jgi:hypothetical protein
MLAKTPCLWSMGLSSICKTCSGSQQKVRILRLSTSAVSAGSPSLNQNQTVPIKSGTAKLNRKHTLAVEESSNNSNNGFEHSRKDEDVGRGRGTTIGPSTNSTRLTGVSVLSSRSQEEDERLRARRLRIRGVVERAEDLLECRLNRLSNSMFVDSLSSATALASASGMTSLFGEESKVFLPSIQKLEGSEHPLLSYIR